MRIGFNPHKDKIHESTEYIHQVVMPVFIPNQDGYFKDSLEVLRLSIQSLLLTCHQKTFITLVDNGSCEEVKEYLGGLYRTQKIHELIHTENIGKLNAVLKGVIGHNMELVTISDSDVLFLQNWQAETVAVYNNFPKAGVVGVVPQFKTFGYHCGNLILKHLFSKKMQFTPVKNPNDLKRFYYSLGWKDEDFNPAHLQWNLTIENDSSFKAVVGSGHFVATYKRAVLDCVITYLGYKMGADSEEYLDELPLKKDLWRLTTADNFAYHMGNVCEEWMKITVGNLSSKEIEIPRLNADSTVKSIGKVSYWLKNKLFTNLFKRNRRVFYRFKGLPIGEVSNY